MNRPLLLWSLVLGIAESTLLALPPPPPRIGGLAPLGIEVVRIVGDPNALRRTFWQRLAGAEPEPPFLRPFGVAWDGDDLLVADPARGAVLRVDSKDRISRSASRQFEGPIGIAVCEAGIVVTDSLAGTVTLLDRTLQPLRQLESGLERPTGVACAGESVYVVETGAHQVVVLDVAGRERLRLGQRGQIPSQFNYPAAIAATATDLWIGDTLNFRVQRWRRLDGEFASVWGQIGDALGDTPRIKGIAVDSVNDRVWLTDAYLDRLTVFSGRGELLADVGSPGSQPGQFSFPAGVALHSDGRIAVADSLNRRVQIFRLIYGTEGR